MTSPSQDRRSFEASAGPDNTAQEIARHIHGLADFLYRLTPQPDMVPDLPQAVTQLRRYGEAATRGTARSARQIAAGAIDTAYRLGSPMHRAEITASGGRGSDLLLSHNEHYAALTAVAHGGWDREEGLDPPNAETRTDREPATQPGNRSDAPAAVTDPVQAAVIHALRDVGDLPAKVTESVASPWPPVSGDRLTGITDAIYVASHEFGQRRGVDAAVGHVIDRVAATRASLGSAAGDAAVGSVLDAVEGAARVRRSDLTSHLYGSGQHLPTHRAHMAAMSAASATAGEPAHQSAGAIARAVWPEGFRDGWRESFWHVNGAVNAAKEFLDEKLYTTVVGNQPAASWLEQVAEQARDIAGEPGDPFPAAKPRRHAAEGDTPTTGQAQAAVSRLNFAAPASAAPRSGAGDATDASAAPPRRQAPRGKSR